jgi:hypothetical protein
MNLYTWNTQLVFVAGTVTNRVNAIIRLCVSPVSRPPGSVQATGAESYCSATVAVAQPLGDSSVDSCLHRSSAACPCERPKVRA